ncbi:hypothetical protein HYH03_014246 [Edaphochlamys debaryana]|uniref:Protein kinase domain-containing protein n=1 Tax=Edaphochlamys debaryana TaxID=47281 RepID=A0A835XQI5_9CHLO|nr:hypothetical protein HYH03_014246 [Edaphochlamys debaryana]|eukprot:KAG2487133.1 hypothetical protein HYH03_014246 [Edaphochlamys debaryana]
MACITAYGAYGCVQKEYSKPLPPIVLPGQAIPDAAHPAIEGEPGSTGVRVTTARGLVAVLFDNSVSVAWIEGQALELGDSVFESAASSAGVGLPFQRTANLTFRGFRRSGDPPLVIFNAVSKLRLGSGVQLAWLSVVILDYSLSLSGWEVLSAGDAATTGARVLVQDSYTIISTCYPAAIAADYQARSVRPPEAPGQDRYTLNLPQPGCSDVPNAPLLQRCWADRYIAEDYAVTGSTLDTVNQRQVPKHYIVVYLNTTALCRQLVNMACITAYGAYGCVQKEYSKPLPPIVLPPDVNAEQGGGGGGSLVPVLVGSIVGGVMGLLLLGSVAALVVVLRRRRAARAQLAYVAKPPPSADGLTAHSPSPSPSLCSGNCVGDDGCGHARAKLSSIASGDEVEAGAPSASVGEGPQHRASSTIGQVSSPTPSGLGGPHSKGADSGIRIAPTPTGASLAKALSGGCGSQGNTGPPSPFGSTVGAKGTWSKASTVITEKTPFRTGVVVDMRVDRDFVADGATTESKAIRAAGCAYTSTSAAGSTRFSAGFGHGFANSPVQGSSGSYGNKRPVSDMAAGPVPGGGRGAGGGGASLPATPAAGTEDGVTAGPSSRRDAAAAVGSRVGSCGCGLPVPAYCSNPGSPGYGHKHSGGEYGYGTDTWPPESGSSGERTDRTDGGGGGDSVVRLLPVVLGKGAAGRVYEGIYDGQRVAVKVLTDAAGLEGEGSIGAVQSFQQELEVLARCEHPNIVRLLAACVRPPRPCVIMERMETSLDKLLYGTPGTLLPFGTVLHIAIAVAQGLEYLHPTIIHRDLKPANVLLNNAYGPTPQVKISDFGLSRLRNTILLTEFPEAGTPAYIAPECFDLETAGISHKADIYSWGVLLWEALAGVRPWQGMGPVPIAMQVTLMQRRLPLPPPADAPGADPSRWPPRLIRLLEEAWDKDPQRRPAAAELVKRLALIRQAADPALSTATSGSFFSTANTGTLGAAASSANTPRVCTGNLRPHEADPGAT